MWCNYLALFCSFIKDTLYTIYNNTSWDLEFWDAVDNILHTYIDKGLSSYLLVDFFGQIY